MVALTILLAVGFDISAIANIGSAVALLISLVTLAHLRIRGQTGARLVPLIVALLATTVTLAISRPRPSPRSPQPRRRSWQRSWCRSAWISGGSTCVTAVVRYGSPVGDRGRGGVASVA